MPTMPATAAAAAAAAAERTEDGAIESGITHAPDRAAPDRVAQCLNCGHPTPLAFCPACGQEAVGAHVRFRDQLLDFFREIFSFESRLPQTLKVLFRRPGELTRAYATGHRVRYVTPLKTFLFAAFAYFGLVSIFQGGLDVAGLQTSLTQISTGAQGKLPPFIAAHLESATSHPEGFAAALNDVDSKVMFVLVPIHALLLKVAYRGAKKVFGEHIVFALHVHAFRFVILAGSTLVVALLQLAARSSLGVTAAWIGWFSAASSVIRLAWICAYLVLAAKRVYGGGTGAAVAKMVGIGAVYTFLGCIVAFVVMVAALMLC
jgi:hypothetical protein